MDTPYYALAAVVVLIVLIAAAVVRRRRRRAADGFMPTDPAPPKVRAAAAQIGEELSRISEAAAAVEVLCDRIWQEKNASEEELAAARRSLAGARAGMAATIEGLRALRERVSTMTPTYQNALSLYRGLHDGDEALRRAAQSLDRAGTRIREAVAAAPGGQRISENLAAAGAQLRHVGACLGGLTHSIHRLGVALRLE